MRIADNLNEMRNTAAVIDEILTGYKFVNDNETANIREINKLFVDDFN